MKIGEKIRAIRQIKGFKQENMANMLNIGVLAYGDIERGKTDIKYSRLEQISAVLNVTVCDIVQFNAKLKTETPPKDAENPVELKNKIDKLELENQLLKAKLEKEELDANNWHEKSLLP